MSKLPYPVYDADHHLYEPEEAFLRYLPKKYENDFLYVDVKGRKKLVVGGVLSDYIPNPTFEVVAAPGVHEMWYRGQNPEGLSFREMTGKPIRPPSEWRTGDGRLAVMDKQGIHAALVFPTLASVIEERLGHNSELCAALFHSLNQWIIDEWGFAREDRLFSVAMIGLGDVDLAIKELEFVLKNGARAIGIRPAPVPHLTGSKSMGLPEYDPFWARVAEAKIFVNFHASDSGYDSIYRKWAGHGNEFVPFDKDPLKQCLELLERPIADSMAAMVCHGALERHPDLRIVSVENGSEWVGPLLARLEKAYGQMPGSFKRNPRDTFQRQVFVAPFYEGDPRELADLIPTERILFGSDYPHPEGLAEPLDYIKEFGSFNDAEMKRVFHSNLKGLLEGKRD